jgi:hypothetical protein
LFFFFSFCVRLQIDSGQLSPAGYLANLANRISRDVVLAKFLLAHQRRPDAVDNAHTAPSYTPKPFAI